jgi:FkbM family methyltransferase
VAERDDDFRQAPSAKDGKEQRKMDWKTYLKRKVERYTGVRLYRYSLPRGIDFSNDARHILIPGKVSVVFDVGANIGQSAEQFRLSYPNARILCFEPVSTTFQELNRRAANWRQVETYQLAFGSMSGPKAIHINSDPLSTVNSFVSAFDGGLGGKETVQVQTLDAFCRNNNIEDIDLIKIDVEGYEIEVLRGAERMLSEGRVKALYLETSLQHDKHCHFVPLTQLDEYLSRFGYLIFSIYDQGMDQSRSVNYLFFCNVAYIHRRLCEKSDVR